MKCIFHIGIEKTGTTFLQSLLTINQDLLANMGYYIPKTLGTGNHRKVSLLGFSPLRRDDYTQSLGLTTPESIQEFNKKTIHDLENELDKCRKRYPYFLVSSEHMHSRLESIPEIQLLKDAFVNLGFSSFQIIVYLRKPSELALSIYSTHLKSGGIPKEVIKPDDPYYRHLCSHRQTVSQWSEVFGHESISIRLYDKNIFINKPLHEDFLEAIGISCISEYKVPTLQNERLSSLAQYLLRDLNVAKITYNNRDKFNAIVASRLEGICVPGLVSPISSADFNEYYQPHCEWIRSMYFPSRSELFT